MNDKAKAAYNEMAKKMDLDYDYKCKLRAYYIKHGSIPDATAEFPNKDHHRDSLEAFRRDRFKSWRSMPKVVKRIVRAAKRAAKAPGLEKLTAEANSD